MSFQYAKYKKNVILFISILLLFLFPILLHAKTFTVNSTADKVDVNIGDGLCADYIGNCTLRAAIQETNPLNGADTIKLPAGTYILSIDGVDEDAAATGDLDITDYLTIIGNSNHDTIIDANQIDRVLSIFGTVTVNISGVKVTNGSGNRSYSGGGISNQNGKVYLTDCTIINNTDVWAGGISNGDEGEMVLLDCIVSDNFSISTAGIGNSGKMKLTNCSIVRNTAGDGNGGIDNRGTMTLINTTVSNNSTSSAGGGISNLDTMALINTTVSGNRCYAIQGGGISNEGEIILTNSTVNNNEGGGIRTYNNKVKLINSIVASNKDGDCVGQINSLGHNLDSDGTCNLTQPNDLPNTDPLLGVFTDDGTPGRGHFPLLEGSPAIDKGNDNACPITDQLGNPRVDGDGDSVITCDIGSIEYQGQPVVFIDVPSGYWAKDSIYKIYAAGITKGCSQNPLTFCPNNTVTRTQMAVFLGRAIHGSGFTPPTPTGIFSDVPLAYWAADWIEQFFKDGITNGCKIDPHDLQAPVIYYCPERPVTRTAMAIFLLRAKHGSNYTPPPATGIFEDVWVNYWAADWIEQLYKEGITVGCQKNPLMYCPEMHVTRAQMAVFIMRTFGL